MSTDANSNITLRVPSKYSSSSEPSSSSSTFTDPPIDWLYRTWCVTHSTLSMWSRARNVRITYSPLPSHADSGSRPRVDDLVEYEKSTGKGGVKTVEGIDTAASDSGSTGSWDWRGKGVLGFVTSHWEVLGWGEREVEGGGSESDRKEGMNPALAGEILAALKGLDAKELVGMVETNMKEVEIKLPWMEK
ncbi:hypothetical protein VP1G_00747 [Cytospora mali]|uniref:Uncharacterized protein n=1 Tax=Cytospora mali TaxID=578113 RepID=A0A194UNC8_CYTMA|nr:hypothetical protein VP1G_00747 [Valsa mali var. pyri (nom. inval.)]